MHGLFHSNFIALSTGINLDMKLNDLFVRFLKWRANNISDAFFVLILSVLIGFLSGLAAGLLKFTVISIRDKLFGYYSDSEQIILLFILPLIGIFLTVIFLKYIIRDNVGHGVPRILYVISKLDASMRRHKDIFFIGRRITYRRIWWIGRTGVSDYFNRGISRINYWSVVKIRI